jgi:hypothetical protein
MERFSKLASLTAFKPFVNAANALEQINAVSESSLTDDLKNFLTMNLPKVGGAMGAEVVGQRCSGCCPHAAAAAAAAATAC